MQGEQYSAEGSQPVYQAEGSQPVATGTVVQQEPVVLSGTVVGMEQPAATTYAVQQPAAPTYTVQQPGKIPVVIAGAPPPTMVVTTATTIVQPAAPAPAGRYLGGNACGCCDPPGGPPLCCTTFWCPCVVVGQLWHRIVERGGGGTVLGILCGVTVGAYVLDCVEIKILRRVRAESSRRPPRHRLLDGAVSSPPNALVDFHTGPRIHYQHFFPNRLDLAARSVVRLPLLHAQDPGGGREGGRVPRPPRALRERVLRDLLVPALHRMLHHAPRHRCEATRPELPGVRQHVGDGVRPAGLVPCLLPPVSPPLRARTISVYITSRFRVGGVIAAAAFGLEVVT